MAPLTTAPTSDPKTLRKRAEQCFRLATNLPPGPNADTLMLIGREYLERAEKKDGIERHRSLSWGG